MFHCAWEAARRGRPVAGRTGVHSPALYAATTPPVSRDFIEQRADIDDPLRVPGEGGICAGAGERRAHEPDAAPQLQGLPRPPRRHRLAAGLRVGHNVHPVRRSGKGEGETDARPRSRAICSLTSPPPPRIAGSPASAGTGAHPAQPLPRGPPGHNAIAPCFPSPPYVHSISLPSLSLSSLSPPPPSLFSSAPAASPPPACAAPTPAGLWTRTGRWLESWRRSRGAGTRAGAAWCGPPSPKLRWWVPSAAAATFCACFWSSWRRRGDTGLWCCRRRPTASVRTELRLEWVLCCRCGENVGGIALAACFRKSGAPMCAVLI